MSFGDDQRFIQVDTLSIPKRYMSHEFNPSTIMKTSMQRGKITRISMMKSFDCYGSSCLNGTVKLWSYWKLPTLKGSNERWVFSIFLVFRDHESIPKFHFCEYQNMLLTTRVSREAYGLSVSTPKRSIGLSGHYDHLVDITEFGTRTCEKYFVTLMTGKDFRILDGSNGRIIREWFDADQQNHENSYSAMFFDSLSH